jgi:predicted transglutaminase-like cysteine proteinase
MIAGSHQAVPVRSIPLKSGDAGIAQTVAVMHSLIDRGAVDPEIRELALGIVRSAGVGSRDSSAEIDAIFWWVKSHMRFQRDVSGGEALYTPKYLLRTMAGDCDDYVVLTGSLLKALGIPVRITTIASDHEEPNRLSHVYLEALAYGQWIPLDATQSQSVPGWAPPRYYRKKIWDNAGLARGSAAGMGELRYGRRSRGLGQSEEAESAATVLNAITPLAQVIGTGVAQTVAAENQPQYVVPAGYTYTGTGDSVVGTLTTSPWIWLILAGIVVVMLKK